MSKLDTTTGNALIAGYMGFNYKSSESYHHIQKMNEDGTPYEPPATKVDSHWLLWNPRGSFDDLMKVVEKIGDDFHTVDIKIDEGVTNCTIFAYKDGTLDREIVYSHETLRECVYRAVVDFITWFNIHLKAEFEQNNNDAKESMG